MRLAPHTAHADRLSCLHAVGRVLQGEGLCGGDARARPSEAIQVGLCLGACAGPGHGRSSLDPTKVLAGSVAEVADGLRAY